MALEVAFHQLVGMLHSNVSQTASPGTEGLYKAFPIGNLEDGSSAPATILRCNLIPYICIRRGCSALFATAYL
ncbi:MAG: hypothetical protein QXV17_02105 [Candidatus Micrarchaeaceae archaeon]